MFVAAELRCGVSYPQSPLRLSFLLLPRVPVTGDTRDTLRPSDDKPPGTRNLSVRGLGAQGQHLTELCNENTSVPDEMKGTIIGQQPTQSQEKLTDRHDFDLPAPLV